MDTISLSKKIGTNGLILALLSGTILSTPGIAQNTLPTGGQVVSGSATITTGERTLTVDQSSDKLIANWESFSIGQDNSVIFNQPNSRSVALNRVIGQDPSQILGSLIANGKVFLVNPNGIVIGKDGMVQAGGFVGSTLNITDEDFLNGNYRFTGIGGEIFNQGDLKGGVVALIAPRVRNEGRISGDAAIAAGTDVTLDFDGDGLIGVEVNASTVGTLVENKGLIKAGDGGIVFLTAKGANDAMKGVVNNSGVIEATSLENRDGRILLLGDMQHGEVNAGGTLEAAFVETSANRVNIVDGIQVKTNGGEWLIDPNDFTIAASGGNITGTTLSNNLANGNVTITTASQGTAGGNGDIFVNDTVSWSANTLTLNADRNININTTMNGSGTAGLALEYAQTDATGDYYVNAPVNLASTGRFSTKKGSAATVNFTIITSLGAQGSTTGTDLQGINGNLTGNYVLGADIDATQTSSWNGGQGFGMLGHAPNLLNPFLGKFDGLGHTITNLRMNRPTENRVGLFGTLGSSVTKASIRNLTLHNADITGSSFVGGVAGEANADIDNVRVVGTVSAVTNANDPFSGSYVGGLIGIFRQGLIRNSFAEDIQIFGKGFIGGLVGDNAGDILRSAAWGKINGEQNVGGIAGLSTGTITDSFFGTMYDGAADSSVKGTSFIGGLVGQNQGDILRSYANTRVQGNSGVGGLVGSNFFSTDPIDSQFNGSVASSFWSLDATGQANACGSASSGTCNATGLTRAQIKDSATFTAAGWDFTNVWAIDPAINNGYPYLRATVAAVAPPPPPPPTPPPPPPAPTLSVNDFGNAFSTSSAPYQPSIALTGTAFDSVTEIRFSYTGPNGQAGTVTWNAANQFGGGRFVVGASGTSATISPVLIAAGDPSGTYQWTVTFVAGSQTITRDFAVTYTAVVVPPPPPPPPPPAEPLLLTSDLMALSHGGPTPWQPDLRLTGSGLNTVTSITLSWIDPSGTPGSRTYVRGDSLFDSRFTASSDGTSAILSPRLLALNDVPGTYRWTLTLFNGGQSVTDRFNVTYSAPQLEAPITTSLPQQGNPVTWGFVTGNATPGLIDMTTAGSTVSSISVVPFEYMSAVSVLRSDSTLGSGIDIWNGAINPTDAASALLPYAFMAQDVYGVSGRSISGWNPVSSWEDILRSGLISQGNVDISQIELAVQTIRETGFNAQVYEKDGRYVLAFEGTSKFSLGDWSTNIQQAVFGQIEGNQYGFALVIADLLTAQLGTRVELTGHSLGGGLAQYVASQRPELNAVTFNAAGIYRGGSQDLSNVVNVRVAGDPISAEVVTNQIGATPYVYQPATNSPNYATHPILAMIYALIAGRRTP